MGRLAPTGGLLWRLRSSIPTFVQSVMCTFRSVPLYPSTQWRRCVPGSGAEYGWISAKSIIKGTQCVKKNLEADAAFEVRVRGINDAGVSGWSRHTVMKTAPVAAGASTSGGAGEAKQSSGQPSGTCCGHVMWTGCCCFWDIFCKR